MKKTIKIILFHITAVALLVTACGQAAPAQPSTPVMTSSAANPTSAPVEAAAQANGTAAPSSNRNKYLVRLMKGVKSWNAWRRDNKDIIPDLSGGDWLQKLDLSRVNFSRVLLVGTNLHSTTLIKADLRFADLSNADLTNADLTSANMLKTKLAGAKYNSATKWPAGFDPAAAGATLVP